MLGATATALYLAEQTASQETPTLVPIVAYPDEPATWALVNQKPSDSGSPLPAIAPAPTPPAFRRQREAPTPPTMPLAPVPNEGPNGGPNGSPERVPDGAPDGATDWQSDTGWRVEESAVGRRLVLPLIHEGVVLGVLVTMRKEAPWNSQERQQAEAIAASLALACVIDQRGQWFQNRLQQRHLAQNDQSATFHDLLHQFRNPLTALQTFGKLLLKRLATEDTNRSIAEGIVRESQRLQDLAGYFDAAVAVGDADWQEADHPPLPRELALPPGGDRAGGQGDESDRHLGGNWHLLPGQVQEVLEPLLLTAQTVAQERQIHFFHAVPDGLPPVSMNAWGLQEVLNNLIDNALKYAPPGAIVWVQAGLLQETPQGPYQGIVVGDTGPGVPAADQARIFERSYRGVQAGGDVPGTGLGLAIAQELTQRMGGHIDLFSPARLSGLLPPALTTLAQGPGTVFILWLPELPPPAAADNSVANPARRSIPLDNRET